MQLTNLQPEHEELLTVWGIRCRAFDEAKQLLLHCYNIKPVLDSIYEEVKAQSQAPQGNLRGRCEKDRLKLFEKFRKVCQDTGFDMSFYPEKFKTFQGVCAALYGRSRKENGVRKRKNAAAKQSVIPRQSVAVPAKHDQMLSGMDDTTCISPFDSVIALKSLLATATPQQKKALTPVLEQEKKILTEKYEKVMWDD